MNGRFASDRMRPQSYSGVCTIQKKYVNVNVDVHTKLPQAELETSTKSWACLVILAVTTHDLANCRAKEQRYNALYQD